MNDEELLRQLERDDRYSVIKVLAEREGSRTELVRDPYARILIRKRIPLEHANERAWRMIAQLDSPLLPRVYEIYQLPDCLTVIVSYVEGISAAELVDQTGPVSPLTAAGYLHDICPAVALLHEHNVVHRDITPSNVVVSQGTAHLIDLGIARAISEEAQHDTVLLGTWGFAAPEQYGFAQTDARSDIYSLGGLLGFFLTGLRPEDQGFDSSLKDPSLVPDELRDIVVRARAFEPSARYQSAEELDAALREAIEALLTNQDQRPAPPAGAPTNPHTENVTHTHVFRQSAKHPKTEPTTQAAEPRASYAAPHTEPHAEPYPNAATPPRKMSLGSTLLLVLSWTFVGLFVIGCIYTGFNAEFYNKPMDVLYFPLAGIEGAITALAVGRETYLFTRRKGSYAIVPQKPHQLGFLLVRRTLLILLIGCEVLFAVAAICIIIFNVILK